MSPEASAGAPQSRAAATNAGARADRLTAMVLFALGVAMLAGGFFMDRLELRRIHPASIPGLVPMLLGGMLALLAVILFRSAGSGAEADASQAATSTAPNAGETEYTAPSTGGDSHVRLILAAAWSVIFALGLVGRLPFELATAIYIAVFVIGFSWPETSGTAARVALVAKGLSLALVGAFGIATLFSEAFLVRLP